MSKTQSLLTLTWPLSSCTVYPYLSCIIYLYHLQIPFWPNWFISVFDKPFATVSTHAVSLPIWFHHPNPLCLLWDLTSDCTSAEKPLSLTEHPLYVSLHHVLTEPDSQMPCKSALKRYSPASKGLRHSHIAKEPQFYGQLTKEPQLVNINIYVS